MVTSDTFIDTLATIEAKRVAKAVQKAQKEEKAALHVMWETSKRKWQRRRESLKSCGLKMELAGPKPWLKDMKLPGRQHMQPLALMPPPTSPIVKTQPYTHCRTLLDSVGEGFWFGTQNNQTQSLKSIHLTMILMKICKYCMLE